MHVIWPKECQLRSLHNDRIQFYLFISHCASHKIYFTILFYFFLFNFLFHAFRHLLVSRCYRVCTAYRHTALIYLYIITQYSVVVVIKTFYKFYPSVCQSWTDNAHFVYVKQNKNHIFTVFNVEIPSNTDFKMKIYTGGGDVVAVNKNYEKNTIFRCSVFPRSLFYG